jgi:ribosome-associated translation inhibitor RaiA
MERPLQITSRDFTLTEAIEALIRKRAESLEEFFDHLTGCHVILEAPAVHHHRKGGPFNVRIVMDVPRTQLTINHQHGEDLSIAVRDAFSAAKRRLEDYVREMRGDVKGKTFSPTRRQKLPPEA